MYIHPTKTKTEISDFKIGNRHIFQVLPSLQLTSQKIGLSKRKGLSSNHPFPGLLLLVFGGVSWMIYPFWGPKTPTHFGCSSSPHIFNLRVKFKYVKSSACQKILKKPTPRT